MTETYTYTIFDADPQTCGACAWDSHSDVELECNESEDAVAEARDALEVEAVGLSVADGYAPGQMIYALVWDADGAVVGQVSHALTAEDLA